MYWTDASGLIELEITIEQARSVSHRQCDEDVEYLVNIPEIKKQLDQIDNDLMLRVLRDYGAWDDEQLQDNAENRLRLVWIAGCDIAWNPY